MARRSCSTASTPDVAVGESVALMGRNGMGKTTLIIRAVAGLRSLPPCSAARSCSMARTSPAGRPTGSRERGSGFVPQGRQVFGSLTVRENLAIVLHGRHGQEPWTIERVFSIFPRLWERATPPRRALLRRGEQQMLAIGRALGMTGPCGCCSMDEPSEGLAPAVLRVIEERLQALRTLRFPRCFVAEQNVDLALRISDRVLGLGGERSHRLGGAAGRTRR